MHFRTRTWFVISLLCFLAAAVFWQLGERAERRRDLSRIEAGKATNTPAAAAPGPNLPAAPASPASSAVPATKTNSANAVTPDEFPHRLTNTAKDVDELSRSEPSILLGNALIDSSGPVQLPIPPHLKAAGDPGSYIVQARGPVTDAFRAQLAQAGAEIVSYVPNNAFLVRASAVTAQQLEAHPETQVVLPWEPYYKLEARLLALAVEQKPLPAGSQLNLLLFPGERDAVVRQLEQLGVELTGEERSVFGPQLAVRVPRDALASVAALTGVHIVEYRWPRKPASDIARARVRVSTNTVVENNYLDLTGAGVIVNVNDTGIDAMHPALAGRVVSPDPFSLEDFSGHGTHVAGIIAGNGANGPTGTNPPPGSVTNANYRGMAPAAQLMPLPIDQVFSLFQSDANLQETAASGNAFISNNSWTYAGDESYTLAAANWDAAARDALPGVSGSQPLVLVFATGNADPALGFSGGRISAPATAKNVITVGAIENFRVITNVVTKIDPGVTNTSPAVTNTSQPWLAMTDSSNQVASFSARGNVGIGTEGFAGRFKPDVVAPGTFVISTRSGLFTDPTANDSFIRDVYPNEVVARRSTNFYQITVPPEGVRLFLIVATNLVSPYPFPELFIHAREGSTPTSADIVTPLFPNFAFIDTPGGGDWFYSIGNTNSFDVHCLVRAVIQATNDTGDYFEVLAGVNDPLEPYYRYETGTSQAAPVVSGMLALIQQRLGITNAPALMKALLINGARTLGTPYDFRVTNALNQQGWERLPNLTNSLPPNGPISGETSGDGSLIYFAESPARALVTGQSFTRVVDLSPIAQNSPFRCTLVWTDPPGNPAVGIKLVNDLDLILTNLTTGQVFLGNNFSLGNEFVFASPTNTDLRADNVNNVENVFLDRRQGAMFSVTVRARRVNVNAVTSQTNGVAQDFALVIATDRPALAGALTVSGDPGSYQPGSFVQTVTNGLPLLNQRVGANFPLISSTNGVTNQWSFFIVTNSLPPSDPGITNGGSAEHIAFITFLSPNLSQTRARDADIDLYVSDNPAITNLDPAVIASSFRSTGRSGTESVVLTNVTPGAIYYVGVKSEDQQSATFGFFAISRSTPFSLADAEGNIIAVGVPLPAEIPDAEEAAPKAALVFALVTQSITVQNVVVTNGVTHENIADLLGVLSHASPGLGDQFSVLNNNRSDPPSGSVLWIFDDSDSGEIVSSIPTDVSGSLRNFVGEEGLGVWQLTMIDNSSFYTGRVDQFVIRIEPRVETNGGSGTFGTILPNRWLYVPVDVPPDATNLFACVAPQNGAVEVYLRRQAFPDRQFYDSFAIIIPPGDCLNLGRRDAPPLSAGRYIVGYYNPNPTPLDFYHREGTDRDLSKSGRLGFRSTNSVEILDEASTNSFIRVPRSQIVADVQVGVRIDHARVSDLVLHVTSPSGTRLLLAENRGGPDAANFGYGELQTNVFPRTATGDVLPDTNVIMTSQSEGTLQIDYQFYQNPDTLRVYYEGDLIFDSGLVSFGGTFAVDYGPGSDTNITITMNESGNRQGNAWDYTATVVSGYQYAYFSDDTNIARLPIKFAPPVYTNLNYSITNVFTNSVQLEDGFELASVPTVPATGTISGWTVDSGVVDALTAASGSNGIPPHTGFYYARLEGSPVPTQISRNVSTVIGSDYQVTLAVAPNPAPAPPGTLTIVVSDNAGGMKSFIYVPSPGGPTWNVTSFVFTATGPITELSLATDANAFGVLIDSVKVEQVRTKISTGIAFQPEETLSPFKGEDAFGNWRLDVWDNRLGGTVTNGVLLAWKLNLAFVNTNPPVARLTNAVAFCGTLASNELAYFVVNVPLSALNATNTLAASANVDLIFNQFGLPTGTLPTDSFFATNVTSAVTVLDTSGWNTYDMSQPPQLLRFGTQDLEPGRRYYLAVRNRSRATNDFCLTVTFDRDDPDLVEVTPITNANGCVSQTISGNLLDYFQVDIPTNTLEVTFTLTPTAQLGLVANPGLPLPNPTSFFRKSDDPVNLVETITVTDFTRALVPGRWYLGVYNTNPGMASISYDLCVSRTDGEVIDLGLGGTHTNRLDTLQPVDYYTITILSNACAAKFCAFPTNGDVDIYVARDLLTPLNLIPTNTTLFSTNGIFGEAECLQMSTFSGAIQLTAGTWVMAVINRSGAAVDYRVEMTQTLNCFNDYALLINRTPRCALMTGASQVDYYQFIVGNTAAQAVFETLDANANVDLYIRYNVPTPFPGPGNFDYASTNGGSTNEFVYVLTNSPLPLAPGTWFLAVSNASLTTNVSYCVRASQLSSNELPALENGVSKCGGLPAGVSNLWNSGVQFFSFAVSDNAFQATFEMYNLSGNADLFLQYGLPLTNFTAHAAASSLYPYASTNPGTAREYLCVTRDSTPVALTNGLWYLAVVNRGTNPVSFCLRATELQTNTMPRFDPLAGGTICTNVARTNVSVLDGIDYYVLPIAEGTVAASIETYGADGNVDLYVQRGPCLVNFATLALGATNYPYASRNSGTNGEWVCVTTNSQPVALTNGDWFIAVVNRAPTNRPVSYCLRTDLIRTNDIQVLSGTPDEFYRGTQRCVAGLEAPNATNTAAGIDYFVIEVPANAAVLELETFNASGNVDLYVQSGPCFPLTAFGAALTNYLYASAHPGTNNEIIWVTTNSAPARLTNGLWYVAVVNRTNVDVSYCLRTRLLLDSDLPPLSNGVARCGSLTRLATPQDPQPASGHGGIDYYVFHVSSNAVFATFEARSTNGNVDLYVQYGPCLTNYATFRGAMTNYPYLSTNIFTNTSLAFYPYASTNLGTNAEAICLLTNSLQVPLREGDWYLAVVNRTPNDSPVDYCVRAIEVLNNQITELANRTPHFTNVVVTNAVANVGVDYYHYRVASNVVQINVDLYALGGNADLYVTRGPCWIDPLQFPYSSTNSGTNAELVTVTILSSPISLTPGDWYFAVVNHEPSLQAVPYAIRVTEFTTNNIITLINCETYVRNALPPSGFGVVTGIVADFYVFHVSTNAVQAVFEIYAMNPGNDVDLYIRRGLPLPGPNHFHYASTNAGSASEWAIVSSNSTPVALAPGPWFLTVVNPTLANATYAIRAYEVTTTNITRLQHAVRVDATVEARGTIQFKPAVNYYVFHVSTNAVQADFKVFAMDGNVDLFLTRNPLPSDTNFLFSSSTLGLADEVITLTTNDTIPLAPGDWYLAVENKAFSPAKYSVCATEYIFGAPGDSGIIRLTNGVPFVNAVSEMTTVPGSGQQYYVFMVSTNALQANFELFDIVGGDANLYLRRGLPLPGPSRFDAASANGGETNELILLNIEDGPVFLTPGDWYLTVVNPSAFVLVDYAIRVTEFTVGGPGPGPGPGPGSGSVSRLAAGQCLVSTNLGTNAQFNPRIDHYFFTVSSNAVRAHVEILAPSGNVDLIVRRGLPLPTLAGYDAISALPGTCEELITIFRDSASGLQLTPGDWFIGVVNASSDAITYTVCASEYTEWGTNLYVSSIVVVSNAPASNSLCLTLTNTLPNVSYYFEGKFSLSTPVWAPASPTIRATANFATWCTPDPPAFRFFRAREGFAPKVSAPLNFVALFANNAFVLRWTGQTNQQFLVEWTRTMAPPNWQAFQPVVTSSTGMFEFIDDGSQTGGLTPFRFYRVILVQ